MNISLKDQEQQEISQENPLISNQINFKDITFSMKPAQVEEQAL